MTENLDVKNVWDRLTSSILSKGGTEDDIRHLVSEGGKDFLDQIADFIIEISKKKDDIFRITVDYNYSFEDAIVAGHYNQVNEEITEANFPCFPLEIGNCGKVVFNIKLFYFDQEIGSKGAILKMKKEKYRPAYPREGFAFGETNPDLQRLFPIVILGTAWCPDHCFMCFIVLFGDSTCRILGLNDHCSDSGVIWPRGTRFLGVREAK